MDHLFKRKRKKSPEPSQQPIVPATVPTNTVAGPSSFQPEQDLDPEADDRNSTGPRVVHRGKVQELWASAPEIDCTLHGTQLTHEEIDDSRTGGGEVEEIMRIAKRGRKGPGLGDTAAVLGVAEETTEKFGPLRAALGAIPATYAHDERVFTIGKRIEDIISRIIALETHFDSCPSDVAEQRHRDELRRKFERIEGRLRSLAKAPESRAEEIPGLLEDMREALLGYQVSQQTTQYNQGCQLITPDEATVLNSFRCARGAGFRHGDRRICLKGTRGTVLDTIELWTSDFSEPPVYWLNGLAGTGKTTIAQTIAERAFADGWLGASFFCSRDFQDRSNLHLVFPTLSIQLARKYPHYRSFLVPLIRSDPEIAYESLHSQMRRLIVQPLKESNISTLIIIDALDECKDGEPASTLLSVLGEFVSEIPKVKFFVTGRPETRIREGFRLPSLAEATKVFVLHEIESGHADHDIRSFFVYEFSELARRRSGLDNWPAQEQLNLLCTRAAGLFIYAVATVKFIDKQGGNPKRQLDLLLQTPESSAREGKTKFKENTTLDSLYTSILQEVFGDEDPDNDPRIRSVLGAVVLTANPLSPSTIATLLGFDVEDVFPLLLSAQSLLILREDVDYPVRPLHKSFPDFIMDPDRCANQRFHIPRPDHHSTLLLSCLSLMNRTLERNICKLPDGIANSDVVDLKERTERYICPALRYACRSWQSHLIGKHAKSAGAPEISALQQFLERNFLFWLEVLSVLGAVRNAVDALRLTAGSLKESPTLNLASDCYRFTTAYFEIICASPQHIYYSALMMAPKTSILRKQYESHAHPLVRIVRGLAPSWDSNAASTTRPFEIELAVWSPCNRFIAVSPGHAMTVEIMDSTTLQSLQSLGFEPPRGKNVRLGALAFSPDGRMLTCSGVYNGLPREMFVVSWELQAGSIVSAISEWLGKFSQPKQTRLAYSMNGTTVGVLLQHHPFVLVFVYDVITGARIYGDRNYARIRRLGRERPWYNIWAHGEYFRYASAGPMTITVWEITFGEKARVEQVEMLSISDDIESTEPTEEDQASVVHSQFLPVSDKLSLVHKKPACGVQVWDARGSKLLLHHMNLDCVPPVTFSSDGRLFACSAGGFDIYLWEETLTGYVLRGKLASTIPKPIPLLSPNGESIIAFGGSTVRSWHTKNLTTDSCNISTGTPQQFANFVLDLLPHRSLAAVARQKAETVTIIDLKSGAPQLTIDTGMEVYGLRVVGNTLVVMSKQMFATWDLPPGEGSTQKIHLSGAWRGSVIATSISHDLLYIALLTEGLLGVRHLFVYDASTGQQFADATVTGNLLWFTPDGRNIGCFVGGKNAEMLGITAQNSLDDATPICDIEDGRWGCPYVSSLGYQVTHDGWVLGPSGKRLLMLPPPWQSDSSRRMWNGRFLALLHGTLAEPIILELEP